VDSTTLALEAIPKALSYVSIAVAAGSVVTRRLLAALPESEPDVAGPADARVLRLGRTAALVLLAAGMLRLLGHTIAAFGTSGELLDSLRITAVESRWGDSWRWQIIAALTLVTATLSIGRRHERRWILVAAAVCACILTAPLLGHAAASTGRMLTHAVHLAAMSAWLGAVIVISVTTVDRSPLARAASAALVARFSPVALAAAGLVLTTGVLALSFYLSAPGDLVRTTYGRVALVKIALVGGIVICGATNWRRSRNAVTPALSVIRLEAGLAVAVLVVTAVLGETEHP
jgi:putative copper export protein